MAEEATSTDAIVSAPAETPSAMNESVALSDKVEAPAGSTPAAVAPKDVAPAPTPEVALPQPTASAPTEAEPLIETADLENTNDKPISEQLPEDKPTTTQNIQEGIEIDGAIKQDETAPAAASADDTAAGTEASTKSKTPARRKSGGIPEHQKKKLNKKASKAKMTHSDARPGDYFMIRLKGYPLWPGIVCDETMLPNTLLKSRPVTAARPDGTYREDYADGGPKVKDRTFPVMYLHTNEFSWIPNTDLVDMDLETVGITTTSMRKDLAAAHTLAAEQHDLDYFKDILLSFMEARQAEAEAKEAAKAAKKAEKAAEKATKAKRKSKVAVGGDADGDVDMADIPAEPGSEDLEVAGSEKKNKKKRKATDDAEDTPKTDSVKKPKTTINLKINSTPKATNGASTPKSAKDSAAKAAKPKSKKATSKAVEAPEVVAAAKEPELSPEEKRAKKEKEILFLRHKLQKGLLTKDQAPKEGEMQQMSEFVNKLEGYADLEVSIIRITKINKVLKAILKLSNIPKEEEFQFKPRSQSLLDKWNKLLATEGTPAAAAPSTSTNGVTDDSKPDNEDAKVTPTTTSNGTKESSAETKTEEKLPAAEESVAAPKVDEASPPAVEEPVQETKSEQAPIESTA